MLVTLSIVTNGLLVSFSSNAVATTLVSASLATAAAAHEAAAAGGDEHGPHHGSGAPPCSAASYGAENGPELYHSIENRYQSYGLWLWFVGIEHAIFLFKFAMELAIDEKPRHTTDAEEKQAWLAQKLRDDYHFGRLYQADRPSRLQPSSRTPLPAAAGNTGEAAAGGGGAAAAGAAGAGAAAAAAADDDDAIAARGREGRQSVEASGLQFFAGASGSAGAPSAYKARRAAHFQQALGKRGGQATAGDPAGQAAASMDDFM
eukprot:SAG22_NODE_2496_length_2510_cov_2.147657_3_plen_261_part_00